MGQNAFVESYKKPNYRLHVVIFLAIIAFSVFLASQVEKAKENADIAALKNPVPIDSIAIEANSSDNAEINNNVPTVKSPVVTNTIEVNTVASISESDQEYSFEPAENQNSLQNLAQLQTEEPLSPNEEDFSSNTEQQVAETMAESTIAQQNMQNSDPQNLIADDPMDQAYQQQQDRFLQTLAKTAQLSTKESVEIKKMKKAIREDKPLRSTEIASSNATSTTTANAHRSESVNQTQNQTIQPVAPAQPQAIAVNMQLPGKNNAGKQDIKKRTRSESATRPSMLQLTRGELDQIVTQFAHSYNKGDINRLMALFAENAITNDQNSKLGIKADYAELFNNTKTRKLMIKDIKWKMGEDKAEGAANFVVTVQPKNSVERNLYHGYIKITAIKQYKDIYITRLIHELK